MVLRTRDKIVNPRRFIPTAVVFEQPKSKDELLPPLFRRSRVNIFKSGVLMCLELATFNDNQVE